MSTNLSERFQNLVRTSANWRARERISEEGERIAEVGSVDWCAVCEGDVPDDCVCGVAKAERDIAEDTHDNSEGDINGIISGTSAVGKPAHVAADDSQVVLHF